jgi:cation diffusion facilitator family transporter
MSSQEKPAVNQEARALRLSLFGYVFMAALGITFYFLTSSEAILLDGVYSLLSFFMALMAGRVAKLVESEDSESFHFGYGHFEPMLNALRGFFILLLCAIALVSAVYALLHGGRPLSPGLGVVYGFSAATGCLLLAWRQRRAAKKVGSPLLVVDARNWLVDGVISLGAGLSFLGAYIIGQTEYKHLVPYVDPALVMVIGLLLIRVPIVTMMENLREVFLVAPDKKVQDDVYARLEGVAQDFAIESSQVRMLKVGRFFYVMIHLVVTEDFGKHSAAELDEIRCQLVRSLKEVHPRLSVDVMFTADPRWGREESLQICA